MENVLSLLTSLDDSEIDNILMFLKEYVKCRNIRPRGQIIPKHILDELISKRMEETKPLHETPEELKIRKREVKRYVQCELIF